MGRLTSQISTVRSFLYLLAWMSCGDNENCTPTWVSDKLEYIENMATAAELFRGFKTLQEKYNQRTIDPKGFKRELISQITAFLGDTAGVAVGTALIPIPGLGSLIAGLVGEYIGDWIGWLLEMLLMNLLL